MSLAASSLRIKSSCFSVIVAPLILSRRICRVCFKFTTYRQKVNTQ
nr:MAG TPA: hypothetical protein [Caudoviricetes sp.]